MGRMGAKNGKRLLHLIAQRVRGTFRGTSEKRGVEHSVPRNFVAQSDFVNRLIIIVEHKMEFRGTFVEHCSTKR